MNRLARALPVCVLAWGHLALAALMSGAVGAVWGVAGFTAGAAIMVPNPVARVHLVQLSAMSLTVIGFGTVLRAMLVGAAQ